MYLNCWYYYKYLQLYCNAYWEVIMNVNTMWVCNAHFFICLSAFSTNGKLHAKSYIHFIVNISLYLYKLIDHAPVKYPLSFSSPDFFQTIRAEIFCFIFLSLYLKPFLLDMPTCHIVNATLYELLIFEARYQY